MALAAACFRLAAPGAELLLSSNDGRMRRGRFRRFVRRGAEEAGVELAQLKDLPDPEDAPSFGEHPLKRLWGRLR